MAIKREAFAVKVGRDGFLLLDLLSEQQPDLLELEKVETLRKVWQQHYTRYDEEDVRWRTGKETLRAAVSIESPYDTEAKYSRKDVTKWTGYKVHFSETCDEHLPPLITNVYTTPATTQDLLRLLTLKTRCMRKDYHRRVIWLMLDMWTAIYWCEARRNTQSSYSDRRAAIPVGNHEPAALMLRSLKLIGIIERCCVQLANKV